MRTRRDFVSASVGAAASLFTAGFAPVHVWPERQAPERRQASIGGKRIRVIDGHCHCAIPITDVVKGTPFESMGAAGNRALGPLRLQTMNQQGVDVQALSINGYWWYAADRDLARRIVLAQNEGLAKWVALYPDRFVAMASVALQYPDLAAQQLEDAAKRLGLRGVSIGGHVNSEDSSMAKYDPFWAKAAELDMLVFMHPGGAENVIKDGALGGRGDLGNIIGNPLDTMYFLSRLIFDGTLDKFPGLRVYAAHAGGYLPSYLGRTDVACDVRPDANCANKRRPRDYFTRNLFVDTMVFSNEGLRHLVAELGAGQIADGTDTPLNWPVTIDLVLNASFLDDAEKAAILGGNLERLLRIA